MILNKCSVIPRNREQIKSNFNKLEKGKLEKSKQFNHSYLRMKMCVENLKTPKEVGCSFKGHLDRGYIKKLITKAAEETPVLIQRKENPSICFLVMGYSFEKRQKRDSKGVNLTDSEGNKIEETVHTFRYKEIVIR